MLSRAVARWRAGNYNSTLDALVDESGNGLHARLGSAVGADTNDPLRLSYRGCKEVYCPGSNNNGVVSSGRTISTATVSERVEISSVDLLTYVGADNCLIGNNSTHQQVRVQSTGVLRYSRYDTTAATFRTADSTVVIPSDAKAVAAEYNGATSVSFYYATTEDLATASWIQFGAAVAITAVATVQASWTPVVGHSTHLLSGPPGTGRVRQARWYRNAVLVDTFDAALLTEPYASYVDPVGGGTWTLNRSASGRKLCVVDRDLLLLGTDDYLLVPNHQLLNIAARQSFTLAVIFRKYGTAVNWLIYKGGDNGAGGDPGYHIRVNLSGGANHAAVLEDTSARQLPHQTSAGSGIMQCVAQVRRGGIDLACAVDGVIGTRAADLPGSSVNAKDFIIGTNFSTYADLEFVGAAFFREELSAEQLIRLRQEMLAR